MQVKDLSLSLPPLNFYFQSQRAGIDGNATVQLVRFIEAAKKTLDCAIYDLKHPDVLAALKSVSTKAKLRIAYDGGEKTVAGGANADPKPPGTEDELRRYGLLKDATAIHVTGGHLMHSKYIVRDGGSVWTGSGNWTHGGMDLQDNNFISIDSVELAAAYEKDFEAMLTKVPTHTRAHGAGTAQPHQITVNNVGIRPFFSGHGTELIEDAISALIKNAKKIRVMAMLISDPGILDALKAFRPAGKDIQGVLDPNEMAQVMKSARDLELFWFAEGDKRFVAAPSHPFSKTDDNNFMHNKVMILDDKVTVAGSYNFSESAETNDENVLIIDSVVVAKAYERYFDALWQQYKKHGAKLPPASVARAVKTHEEELVPA